MILMKANELKQLRFHAKQKFSKANKMFFYSLEQIEQATPEIIAFYRAKRLKCNTIIDACCGIGMDAIALAKHCKKVIAIDKSSDAIDAAKKNALVYGVKNIEFIEADSLSLDFSEFNAELLFADPSRRINGKRVKDFNETMPSTIALINKCLKESINGFCIEVSREFFVEEIPFKCEKEFISIKEELNSISLYFGSVKKASVSAVVLPEEEKISTNRTEILMPKANEKPKKYLFELNDSIVNSRLYFELLEKLKNKAFFFNENFFSSEKKLKSIFFKNSFEVLRCLENKSMHSILMALNELNAGSIVLRGSFSSEKEFNDLKQKIESNLFGSQKIHLFLFKDKAIICKNLRF